MELDAVLTTIRDGVKSEQDVRLDLDSQLAIPVMALDGWYKGIRAHKNDIRAVNAIRYDGGKFFYRMGNEFHSPESLSLMMQKLQKSEFIVKHNASYFLDQHKKMEQLYPHPLNQDNL